MNTKRSLISLLVLSSAVFASGVVTADPVSVSTYVACPGTQNGSSQLTNFGNYIAGFGSQSLLSQTVFVYFKSEGIPSNTPGNLTNYFNDAAAYDSTTGRVSCSYQSSISTDPYFTVSYTLTNGRGGAVQGQTNNAISILFPVGLKA